MTYFSREQLPIKLHLRVYTERLLKMGGNSKPQLPIFSIIEKTLS